MNAHESTKIRQFDQRPASRGMGALSIAHRRPKGGQFVSHLDSQSGEKQRPQGRRGTQRKTRRILSHREQSPNIREGRGKGPSVPPSHHNALVGLGVRCLSRPGNPSLPPLRLATNEELYQLLTSLDATACWCEGLVVGDGSSFHLKCSWKIWLPGLGGGRGSRWALPPPSPSIAALCTFFLPTEAPSG